MSECNTGGDTPPDHGPAWPRIPPLSPAQQGLWLLDQLHSGSSAYNVTVALRLTGALDVGALGNAFHAVLARHDILRTTFPSRGGRPFQRIAPVTPTPLPLTDLSAHPPANRDRLCSGLVHEWAEQPFDLEAGPLVRSALIRLDVDDHVLALVIHHMVCDGPSLHLLFDELAALYGTAEAESGPSELPRLTVQYADYAAAQQEREPADSEVEWWREYLSGAPVRLALPVDRPHPAVRGTAGATYVARLPKALMDQVGELARTTRTSPFMVMLAVYGALLGRLCETEDLLVGTPVSGRSTPELEPLIGFFAQTDPVLAVLRARPPGHALPDTGRPAAPRPRREPHASGADRVHVRAPADGATPAGRPDRTAAAGARHVVQIRPRRHVRAVR
jgi:hypothetical protein